MSGRAIFGALLGAGAAALVAASACSTQPTTTAGGDFVGPIGLAMTWAQDRDLLFISNAASNELRALNICTSVPGTGGGVGPLPDGGVDPNTCPPREAFQFVPGPIRVFPGSVPVGNRPVRLAGARLLDAVDAPVGAVLGVGSESALRLVDANNLLAASKRLPGVVATPPQKLPLTLPAIDVVASDQPGRTIRAFTLSDTPPGGSAVVTGFDLTVANGAPMIAPVQHCTLDFVGTRLALVPGRDDLQSGIPAHLYIGDGTPNGTAGGIGDGAVEVSVSAMPTFTSALAPCTYRRLRASDPADLPLLARPLRSIALSPTFYTTPVPTPVPGGLYLMGVTLSNPALCGSPPPPATTLPKTHTSLASDPTCGSGGVIFIKTNVGGTSQVARAPRAAAVDLLNPIATDPPMAPLRPPTPAREVSFFLPRPGCLEDNGAVRSSQFCTDLSSGSPGSGLVIKPKPVQLGAVATLEDGGAAYISASDLRFVNDQADNTGTNLPPGITTPTLSPTPLPTQKFPLLAFPNDSSAYAATTLPNPCLPNANTFACMTSGVTRTVRWRIVWRSVIPGLETVAGVIRRTPANTLRLELPSGRTLTPWTSSGTVQLQVGDVVRLIGFSPSAAGTLCDALLNFNRATDLFITAIEPGALEFSRVTSGSFKFDPPDSCNIDGLGAAVEVHTASHAAGEWLVFAGQDVRGRVPHGEQFVAYNQRFDYPPLVGDPPPPVGIEIAFAPASSPPNQRTDAAPDPNDGTLDGTSFTFAVASNLTPTTVRDLATFQGFADGVLTYQNRNAPGGILYVALTGANSLLQASPGNLGSPGAVAVYR